MAANGNLIIGTAPKYEDYSSLKKYLGKEIGDTISEMNLVALITNQPGTDAEVEIENAAGETIADIGKTELALLLAGDADDASSNGLTFTLTYLDSDLESHVVVGTGTSTLNTTPVAFVPAVADFYAPVSFVASAGNANVVVYAATAAIAAIYATITAAATESTEAQLVGVGSVSISQKTDQVATDGGQIATLDYLNPNGVLKYALATVSVADTSVEVNVYEATKSVLGVYTATTVLVKDFYRRREFRFAMAATDELLLTAIGGAAVYGVIAATYQESIHSRYVVPVGRSAYLAHICVNQSIATNLDVYMTITYTPYGETVEHNCTIAVPNNNLTLIDPLFRMAEGSEFKAILKGNGSDNTIQFHIIETITK